MALRNFLQKQKSQVTPRIMCWSPAKRRTGPEDQSPILIPPQPLPYTEAA